jgi:hypothetical protein
LQGKFLFYYAALLLVLKLITLPVYLYLPKSVFFADLTKTILLELTNDSRIFAGLQPLKENPALEQAAFLKAQDMLEKNYFSHQSPEGLPPWNWLSKAGYNYQFAGENLAIGFLDSEEVHSAWINSAPHQKNILNKNYQEIGIAVVRGNFQGNDTNLVVQFFGSKRVSPGVLEEKETPFLAKEGAAVFEQELALEEKGPAPEKSMEGLGVFYFLTYDYHKLLERIIYGTLIFVVVSLFLTLFFDIFLYRAFSIEYKDIVLKTFFFSLLLVALLMIDKTKTLQLIPHNFNIY